MRISLFSSFLVKVLGHLRSRRRRVRLAALVVFLSSSACLYADVPSLVLVDQSLSTTTARDGQTFQVNYCIFSSQDTSASLGASLYAPGGVLILDPDHEGPALQTTVHAGTNWYSRPFFLNLPPDTWGGTYGVTWTMNWGTASSASNHVDNLLTVPPAIPVRIPILMYHKVGPAIFSQYWVTDDAFRSQMLALKAYGYTAVTLQDVMNYRAGLATPPAKPVVITFDDGYENLLTDAYPILSDPAIGFKATSFIITGRVGTDNSWDGDNNPLINLLTWSEIQSLHATGLIDFESHTVTHPDLTSLAAPDLVSELVTSKSDLESHLARTVSFLSYPHGNSDWNVSQATWLAGYVAAVVASGGVENTCSDRYALDRIGIYSYAGVSYDLNNPQNFFFGSSLLNDPDVVIPVITIDSIQCLDPTTQQPLLRALLLPGQSVLLRANARNIGSSAPVVASLQLDSDDVPQNGISYDSHLTVPSQDWSGTFAAGTGHFDWLWQVPANTALGQYYASATIHDPRYVLTFANTGWQSCFKVAADASATTITVDSVQYLDPKTLQSLEGTSLLPGQTVLVRAHASNVGPAVNVTMSLQLDSDDNHQNGLAYDSHAAVPSQDWTGLLAPGPQQVDWLWQIPAVPAYGQYLATVKILDAQYAHVLAYEPWEACFRVITRYPTAPATPVPGNPVGQIGTLVPIFMWTAFKDGGDGDTQAGFDVRVRCDDEGGALVYETGFIPNTTDAFHVYCPGAYVGHDPVTGFDRVSLPLEWNKLYHWHVRYRDSGGDWSDWSANDSVADQQFFRPAFNASSPGVYHLAYMAGPNGTLDGATSQTTTVGGSGTPVTAIPAANCFFLQWTDGVLTATRMETNVMADLSVAALFAKKTVTLTYSGGAHGSISGANPQTVNYASNGTAVTAVPAAGYTFSQWSDGVLTATRTDTHVTADLNVTANFTLNTYTLAYTAGTHGSISGTTPQTVNYGADGTPVTAVGATGYAFSQWSDGVLTATRTDTRVMANISVSASFVVDRTPPTVLSVNCLTPTAQVTNAAQVTWRVTFSEPMNASTVQIGDFTLLKTGPITGQSKSGAPVAVAGSNNTQFDVTANTGSRDGTLRLDVLPPASLKDLAGNSYNAAFTSGQTYTIDKTAPTCTVSGIASPTAISPMTFTIQFSEPVTGLTAAAVTVTNGTKGSLTGSGAGPYSLPVTPLGQGAVTCLVPAGSAQDAAGNVGTASNTASVTYDTVAPTATITAPASPTKANPIPFTVNFSEPVTGLTPDDFTVTNAIKTIVLGTGSGPYTLWVIPLNQGTVTCQLPAASTSDGAGNPNLVSNTASVVFDSVAPTATVTGPASPTNASPILFTIAFSEPVTGLSAAKITVANGSKGALSGSDAGPYTLSVTPSGQGAVTCKVPASATTDLAGNANPVSNTASVTYDSVAPTCTITGPSSPTKNNPITFTIRFSESVTGLTASEITITNGTKGALSGSGSAYTLPVTPSGRGVAVTCKVPAGSASDAASNGNAVSNLLSITYNGN